MTPVLKGFVAVPHGQVHFRYGGSGPVVVMLHDSPRSSALHASNIEWLGEHFTVIALDMPGYGNSTPLPQDVPGIKVQGHLAPSKVEALHEAHVKLLEGRQALVVEAVREAASTADLA